MANALSFQVNALLQLNDAQLTIPFQPQIAALAPASALIHSNVVSVGTVEETLSQGEVTAPHYLFLANLDAVNFVRVGPDAAGIQNFVKLLPGDFAVIPIQAGVVIKAVADTAAVNLYVLLVSN